MLVVGVDPGPKQSAYVQLESELGSPKPVKWKIAQKGHMKNQVLKDLILRNICTTGGPRIIVIEDIRSYNQKVGNSTFQTKEWIGRFRERWEGNGAHVTTMPRRAVSGHLSDFGKSSNDKYVNQELVRRFGEVGTAKNPGPLYGFKSHLFAALAVAVTYVDVFIIENGVFQNEKSIPRRLFQNEKQ